jgi:hypothetical protein
MAQAAFGTDMTRRMLTAEPDKPNLGETRLN